MPLRMDFEAFAVSMAVKTAVWPADSEALIRMPAASALRAEKVIAERNRGAHPCVAQALYAKIRLGLV